MSLHPPQAVPESWLSDFPHAGKKPELARRLTRFTAVVLDGVVGVAVMLPVVYQLGLMDLLLGSRQVPPQRTTLAGEAFGFLTFLLLNGYLLKRYGQTIGKWLTGIRIVDLDGGVPGFATLILWRYLPMTLVGYIPVVGSYIGLVNTLFIFRRDRRCLHDLIAGTQVVVVTR